MAENPTGGAGESAADAAESQAGAATDKASAEAGSAAQQGKDGHDSAVSQERATGKDEGEGGGDGAGMGGAGIAGGAGKPPTGKDVATKVAQSNDAAPDMGDSGGVTDAADLTKDDKGPGGDVGSGPSGGKMAGMAAAVPAAGVVGQIMFLAMIVNLLKGMMMAGIALAANLWSMIVGAALGIAKAVVGAIMSVGGAVAGALGGALSAAVAGTATAVAGALVGAVLVVTTVVGINSSNELARKDGVIDCGITATAALDKVDGSDTNVDATTLANAKTVFGVLSAWGMPDENVAGILGNWDAESGIDPTSVEGIFDERFHIGPRKQAAWDTNFDHMGYVPHSGIGLGQWTNGRNLNLQEYADSHGVKWHTMETQLGFMISAAEGSDAEVVKDMMVTPYGTPGQAALHFHDAWERSADTPAMAERRAANATKWMGMFGGWDKNQSLADSILAQAGTTVGGANSSRSVAVRAECLGVGQASLTMDEGGLSLEEATALMATYRVEGDEFLLSRYGAGGPGECSGGKSDNCVSFSTYFVNKFTSFQQYARGDGYQTAGSMAELMGKTTSTTPTVYSVVSGPGSSPEGHTFVILGIDGDMAVIGEASCNSNHAGTRARLMPLSELSNGTWTFVDVSDLMLEQPKTA